MRKPVDTDAGAQPGHKSRGERYLVCQRNGRKAVHTHTGTCVAGQGGVIKAIARLPSLVWFLGLAWL